MAKILKLNAESEKEVVKETVCVLKNSGIAVVPTDTVYGIVCDGDNDEAKKNIYLIKGRQQSKPLIGFVDSFETAKKFAFIPEKFLPFILCRWPGRHTFIFKSKIESRYIVSEKRNIALRIPDFGFINHLSKNFRIIASTSANISSAGSVSSIENLSPEIAEKVSIVVDAGDVKGQESAIWDLTGSTAQLVRGNVLFVCSGNSCRSPMAQVILQNLVGSSIRVISAGTAASLSGSMTEEAKEALEESGINVEGFISTSLTSEMIDYSDLIFVMEEKHRETVLNLSQSAHDKTFVLDVPDPAGSDIFQYRKVRDIIKDKINEMVLTRIKR